MSLNNLAVPLQTRFEQRGASNDLDEAIYLLREALLLRPAPHPDRSMSLNNLAATLQTCFEQRGASNDLDEAISLRREVLLLRPAPHRYRSWSLHNLANALQTRFEQRGASKDLDEVTSLRREALLLDQHIIHYIPIYSNTLPLPCKFGLTKATSYKTSLKQFYCTNDFLIVRFKIPIALGL